MVSDDILLEQHRREKDDSVRFKERRTEQWNENYFLYRDKIHTNRLTQRQPVNIPVIRETIQTWISKIDEQPQLSFEARGNQDKDKRGELLVNEMWKFTYDSQHLTLLDNLDKKIVGLQGRSFKYWKYEDGMVKCNVIDPYDIDIDPRVNPFDLNTAAYINHKNIFVPLRRILANPTFSNEGKMMLKTYLSSKTGLLRAKDAEEEYEEKMERLRDLGADNYDEYRASDVLVELNYSYKLLWVEAEKKFVRHLIVTAMDQAILYAKPLKKAIGIDFLPFTSWASDPDLNDIWSDGIADSVRTINKVINIYFSQDIENRSYRNFGMYFYNTQNGTFQPQAFDAKPFGMYGVPGNPDEIIKQMQIQPLDDTTSAMEYLKNMVQSSVAQTPTERGEQLKSRTTLGEVQLNLQASQSRNEVVAKQYQESWRESGRIWYELMKNNATGTQKIFKRAPNGEMQSKDVAPNEWKVPKGYECKVVLKTEKEQNDDMEFQKIQFVKQSFQNNPVALKLARRKELEILGWTPDEIAEVMSAEEQQSAPAQAPGLQPPGQSGNPQQEPATPPATPESAVSLDEAAPVAA
jgi:hypothetical protein